MKFKNLFNVLSVVLFSIALTACGGGGGGSSDSGTTTVSDSGTGEVVQDPTDQGTADEPAESIWSIPQEDLIGMSQLQLNFVVQDSVKTYIETQNQTTIDAYVADMVEKVNWLYSRELEINVVAGSTTISDCNAAADENDNTTSEQFELVRTCVQSLGLTGQTVWLGWIEGTPRGYSRINDLVNNQFSTVIVEPWLLESGSTQGVDGTTQIVAHEIGHSLGLSHLNTTNDQGDLYLMTDHGAAYATFAFDPDQITTVLNSNYLFEQ